MLGAEMRQVLTMRKQSVSDSFDSAQLHFSTRLRNALNKDTGSKDEPYLAVPDAVIKEILPEQELKTRVLEKVLRLGSNKEIESYARKILEPPGLRTTLLIIMAFGTLEMLTRFEHCLLQQDGDISDNDLPLTTESASRIFGEHAKSFSEIQFELVAIKLVEGTYRAEYRAPYRLPYLEQEEIGDGAYGTVYKVKIERGRFFFHQPPSSNLNPVFLARKDFEPDKEFYDAFKAEDSILRDVINSSSPPKSIMTSTCSLTYSLPGLKYPRSSIFFPEAKCDLYAYLASEAYSPRSGEERLRNFNRMLGICRGLEWLRKNLVYLPDDDQYSYAVYSHCDLKPDNILVCEDGSTPSDPITFKITDFGKARGLQSNLLGASNRKLGPAPGAEGSGRQGTYLAPDVREKDAKTSLTQKTDVWPLGCIFLMIFLFNYHGAQVIQDFENERLKGNKWPGNVEMDSFAKYGSHTCSEAVTARIKGLMELVKSDRNQIDSKAVGESLKYLETKMLVKHSARDDVVQVSDTLHKYYNMRPPLSAKVICRENVPHRATHCGNSPDGRVLFYSPTSIAVYMDNSPCHHRLLVSSRQDKWPGGVRPRSRSCAKNILFRMSHSTTGSFQGEIRDISAEKPVACVEISQAKFHVEMVAISPDGRLLALACRPKEDRHAKGRVQMFDFQIGQRIVKANSTSTLALDAIPLEEELLGKEGYLPSVKQNLDLCFSADNQTLYHASFLTEDPKASAPRVRVTMWNTTLRLQISECIINDTYIDFPHQFITSIVPFNTKKGFICITHEKFITRRVLSGQNFREQTTEFQGAGNLKTILLSPDDQRVVMLAKITRDGYVDIYSGSIAKPGAARKLDISDKIHYFPDKDNACVKADGGSTYILITSFRDKKTYKFDIGRI